MTMPRHAANCSARCNCLRLSSLPCTLSKVCLQGAPQNSTSRESAGPGAGKWIDPLVLRRSPAWADGHQLTVL